MRASAAACIYVNEGGGTATAAALGNNDNSMLLNLGGSLVSSHAVLYPLLPDVGGSLTAPRLTSTGLNLINRNHSSSVNSSSIGSRRRRTRPNSASAGPRFLHPSGSLPEGVPSSLFNLQLPPRATPTEYPSQTAGGSTNGVVAADGTVTTAVAAAPPSSLEEVTKALEVRLVEETDLPDISALLAEVFEPSILIDATELRSEGSVERLEKANKYLKDMAYKKILRSIKSRCGKRLARGDFALTSDALVMAVREGRSDAGASTTPATHEREQELGAGGGGDDAGEIVAVVELCLRQPEGFLPFNGLFDSQMGWQPYMCNLAVAEKYRRNGYGKQLVLLCENLAKGHWGYKRMYLHVDADSAEATGLYSSMGYETMEQFEPPLWVKRLLGLRNIRYQVKHFNGKKGPVL